METVFLPSPPYARKTVTAVGFFDGVHIGHRALLCETVRLAREIGAVPALFTFDVLPCKEGAPLSSLKERLSLFEACGIEAVFISRFEDVASLSPRKFVEDILKKLCGARAAVCGYNFRFGKNAVGTASDLLSLLPQSRVLDALKKNGVPVSSSRIRALLAEGKVEEAKELLGAPYTLCATVEHGKALGRTLGFPTVNMRPGELLPKDGVYETRVRVGDALYAGVTDIGHRPTVEGAGERRMETHLIGYTGNLYGQALSVSFVRRMRDELTFESPEALALRLRTDAEEAERNFKHE